MKSRHLLPLVSSFFGTGLLLLLIIIPPVTAGTAKVDCDIQKKACNKTLKGHQVTLQITPKPVKALHDLVFNVTVDGAKPATSPYIDLGMPAMEMGPNRVYLSAQANGSYEGHGVIVRCKSGIRIWQATVTLPGMGSLIYTFEVIYEK